MKINEYFVSLQGEGKYSGQKVLFIRLSGCNLKCDFCDTQYHNKVNYDLTPKKVAKFIRESKCRIVVWTGGEPLLQLNEIIQTIQILKKKAIEFQIETNGEIAKSFVDLHEYIDYISCSPKNLKTCKRVYKLKYERYLVYNFVHIKVVTDGEKLNMDMIKYADYLMPLTTYNKKKDAEIRKKVWELCVKHNKIYCERLQNIVFGKRRGV